MPYFIDLGGAPANEECAQLGHTQGFSDMNAYAVAAYHVGIIARFGQPPPGCRLAALANRHDFGTYRTLVLHVENELDAAVRSYADQVEEGLGSWLEAGITPPVSYEGTLATISHRDRAELIIGALQTTRPDADGSFPLADFAVLHRHLSEAFPAEAVTARARLAER